LLVAEYLDLLVQQDHKENKVRKGKRERRVKREKQAVKDQLVNLDQQDQLDHKVNLDLLDLLDPRQETSLLIQFLRDPTTMQQRLTATLESIAKNQQQYIYQRIQRMEELLSSKLK
jgi:hypothetical protein